MHTKRKHILGLSGFLCSHSWGGDSVVYSLSIVKFWLNSRIKPLMYVRRSAMYEKAAFCWPEMAKGKLIL